MIKKLFSRAVLTALIVLIEVALIALSAAFFSETILWLKIIGSVAGGLTAIFVINKKQPAELKLPWIILLTVIPILGTVIYIFLGNAHFNKKEQRAIANLTEKLSEYLKTPEREKEQVKNECGRFFGLASYLGKKTTSSVSSGNHTEFLPSGETFFKSLLADIKTAEKFIFMEYFIIEEGKMWDSILDVLKEKVGQGVEVRVLYDDIGCAGKLKGRYYKTLNSYGIKSRKFNAITLRPSGVFNNRDHRKITVIDGVIGYMSGINLADEYINEKQPFGYWKDTGVRVSGKSVATLTALFLTMYDYKQKVLPEDYSAYFPKKYPVFNESGCVIPFGCGPLYPYDYQVGRTAIISLLASAKHKAYVTTPYLIIDHEFLNAISTASLRGVDVKVITPGIPDKKFVYSMTKSSYMTLLKNGVEIYEYTPGFMHAKQILIDNDAAFVGTINLDYRSLAHHFECGAIIANSPVVNEIQKDFDEILSASKRMTAESSSQNPLVRLVLSVFALFRTLL